MLDNLDSLWSLGQKQEKTYSPIPEGVYNVTLHDVGFDLTKQSPRVTLKYKISDDGEFFGRILFANYTLSEKGVGFLKSELAMLGYLGTPKNLDDLSNEIKSLIDKTTKAVVKVKTREYKKQDGSMGTANDVYVQRLVSDELDKTKTPEPNFDEDLPF